MITKEEFKNFIYEYKSFDEAINRIDEALSGRTHGLDLFECDWYNSVGKMLDIFLESHFNEYGVDIITWWLFEDVNHIIYQDTDPDLFNGKSKIEYDVNELDNLWNYLITYKNNYIKDV